VYLVYGIAFLTTSLIRVAIHEPFVTPDGVGYLNIAQNVLHKGCYSDLSPAISSCIATWSNQPPGYPFLLLALIALFGETHTGIVVVQ
jgi:hypothetical protein